MIESSSDFASELDVCNLVIPNRDRIRFVKKDVRRLKQRIAEEAVGIEIVLFDLGHLFFVRRYSLQPRQRNDHRKQKMQFGMFDDVRLNKNGRSFGIDAGGQP